MALTQEQIKRLEEQHGTGLSSDSFAVKELVKSRLEVNRANKETGFFADIKGIGTGIKEDFARRQAKVDDIQESDQESGSKLFQSLGQSAGLVSDVIGQTLLGGAKALTPQPLQEAIGSGVEGVVGSALETETAQNIVAGYNKLKEENPDFVRNLEATAGFGSLALDAVGVGLASKGGKATVRAGREALDTGLDATRRTVQRGKDIAEPVTGLVKKKGGELFDRARTNIDEVKRVSDIKKTLTPKLERAVTEGMDITEAQFIKSIPAQQKALSKNLWETTKRYLDDVTRKATDPIAEIGRPIFNKVKRLDTEVKGLNKQLTTVATGLRGKSVIGMDDIKTSIRGSLDELDVRVIDPIKGTGLDDTLDFTGSQLEKLGNNDLIKTAYKKIVNAKDANDLHKAKQFIYKTTDYTKKTSTGGSLSSDGERLLQSWARKVDAQLDNQFKAYRGINDKLSLKISPLNEMQKRLRANGFDEDLVQMKAGLLARRLTSNAQSGPEIRQILRDLDKATEVAGKVTVSTETLQDLYNILVGHFPELTGKTSLRGAVTGGIEDVVGVKGLVEKSLKAVSGKTPEVQQKAIREAYDELFN